MSLERRSFLRFALFAPPAASAAEKLVSDRGGVTNLLIPPDPVKVQRARDAVAKAAIIEPYVPDFMDVRHHGLYDLLRVPAGVEVPDYWPFFAQAIGYNEPGSWKFKTLLETNSVRGCQLPPPEQMYIERILFLFTPQTLPADRDQLLSRYYFELMLGDKVVARAPLARCPVSGELSELFDCGTDGRPLNRLSRNTNTIDPPFALHLERPVHLPAMAQYVLNVNGRPFKPAGQLELYAILDGIAMLGVQ